MSTGWPRGFAFATTFYPLKNSGGDASRRRIPPGRSLGAATRWPSDTASACTGRFAAGRRPRHPSAEARPEARDDTMGFDGDNRRALRSESQGRTGDRG